MDISQPLLIKELLGDTIDLQPLIDEIPLAVVILDTNRRIVLFNRAYEVLTGFPLQDAVGISCFHILRSKTCIKDCPALRLDRGSDSACVESDIINRDRRLIPVRMTLSQLKTSSDKVVGFIETVQDVRPLQDLNGKVGQAYGLAHLIGRSPQMKKVFQLLPVFAQSDSSILITGETGTGKDMFAEAIHQASNRSKGPFVKVNCGALPETLMESELFGHQKGAFTGAIENKPGRFRLAHNGTLYLTEIGDLPLSLQVKLLTFFDDQVVYPLGSTKGFQTNVRIIAATHRNLEKMVDEDRFRKDLLYRLNVVRIHIPPLRERHGDVRLLLDHFLNTITAQFSKNIKKFSSPALRILKNYLYPGNVRELRNIIEYAVNICQERQIQPYHLPTYLVEMQPPSDSNVEADRLMGRPDIDQEDSSRKQQTWAGQEKKMIMDALLKTGGRRNKAAALLGWGRSTLWRKMKRYGID